MYSLKSSALAPLPVSGKVMRIVWALGRILYGSGESEAGSNRNFRVPSRPVVVVAAWEICSRVMSGMRKVEVHPAPRMSIDTGLVFVCYEFSTGRREVGGENHHVILGSGYVSPVERLDWICAGLTIL